MAVADLERTASSSELSLIEGGPGDMLLRRVHLAPPRSAEKTLRLALLLAALSWVPLALLSLFSGLAWSGCTISFVKDLAAHFRFLFSLPVLILAEIPVEARLAPAVRQFAAAGLVRADDLPRFRDIIRDAVRFRDWRQAEIGLLVLTAILCWLLFHAVQATGTSTWFQPEPGGRLSLAGWWYAVIALPIYQFLLWRWVYRLVVWSRFLWQLTGLDLALTPSHPDGAGGLSFLGRATVPFGLLLFALSAVLSAEIAEQVIFIGANLSDYWVTYVTLAVLGLVIFVGPLLIFVPMLFHLKHEGLMQYGALATTYTQQFQRKWIGGAAPAAEPLLGSGDIQSLADLANSYEVVRRAQLVPIDRNDIIALLLSVVLPALPLVLTVMPLAEIFKALLKAVA
jgi:hypothetical protein